MCARSADAVESPATLPREFFARNTESVARDLVGALLIRASREGTSIGRIVETEAYGGPDDLASHARAGRTRRTTPMFGRVGHAYVYLIYGMYECLNVVAHAVPAEAGAVLLRAIEPIAGVELMRGRRGRPLDPGHRLASGPARLCQALGVDRSFDGHDLLAGDRLWLAHGERPPASAVAAGPRIGVDYAGAWAERPWRFWLRANPCVSRRST